MKEVNVNTLDPEDLKTRLHEFREVMRTMEIEEFYNEDAYTIYRHGEGGRFKTL